MVWVIKFPLCQRFIGCSFCSHHKQNRCFFHFISLFANYRDLSWGHVEKAREAIPKGPKRSALRIVICRIIDHPRTWIRALQASVYQPWNGHFGRGTATTLLIDHMVIQPLAYITRSKIPPSFLGNSAWQVIDVLTYHGEGVASMRDNGPAANGKIDYFAAQLGRWMILIGWCESWDGSLVIYGGLAMGKHKTDVFCFFLKNGMD